MQLSTNERHSPLLKSMEGLNASCDFSFTIQVLPKANMYSRAHHVALEQCHFQDHHTRSSIMKNIRDWGRSSLNYTCAKLLETSIDYTSLFPNGGVKQSVKYTKSQFRLAFIAFAKISILPDLFRTAVRDAWRYQQYSFDKNWRHWKFPEVTKGRVQNKYDWNNQKNTTCQRLSMLVKLLTRPRYYSQATDVSCLEAIRIPGQFRLTPTSLLSMIILHIVKAPIEGTIL